MIGPKNIDIRIGASEIEAQEKLVSSFSWLKKHSFVNNVHCPVRRGRGYPT